jgi:hypothetical protein
LTLIGAGFSEEEVLELAIDKFEVYVEQVRKGRLMERAETVIDFAMAASGLFDSKGTKKHVDSLIKDAR